MRLQKTVKKLCDSRRGKGQLSKWLVPKEKMRLEKSKDEITIERAKVQRLRAADSESLLSGRERRDALGLHSFLEGDLAALSSEEDGFMMDLVKSLAEELARKSKEAMWIEMTDEKNPKGENDCTDHDTEEKLTSVSTMYAWVRFCEQISGFMSIARAEIEA